MLDVLSGLQRPVWQRKGVNGSQSHHKDVSAVLPTSRQSAQEGRLIGACAPERLDKGGIENCLGQTVKFITGNQL